MIVEADADLIRRMGRESLCSTDHGAGWGTLSGEVDAGLGRWVETIFVRKKPAHTQRFRTGAGWSLEFALKPDESRLLAVFVEVANTESLD